MALSLKVGKNGSPPVPTNGYNKQKEGFGEPSPFFCMRKPPAVPEVLKKL